MPLASPSASSFLDEPSDRSPTDRGLVAEVLADVELRRYLESFVRRRVNEADADDVIQSVLCAALEAKHVPLDREEVRKWITTIARRKLAGHYDKSAREQLGEPPDVEANEAPLEAASLMRWAERQAAYSEADRVDETLDWMARESDGEKLETIATEARVPATSVRQRVSRMRRWMKARWVAELAAVVAALLVLSLIAWWFWARHVDETAKDRVRPDPSISAPLPAGSPPSKPSTTSLPTTAPSSTSVLPMPSISASTPKPPVAPTPKPTSTTTTTLLAPTSFKPTGHTGTGTGTPR